MARLLTPDIILPVMQKYFAEFAYSKYEEGKGGTQIIDKTSGNTAYFGGDAAGIANNNYTVTAGLQYRF